VAVYPKQRLVTLSSQILKASDFVIDDNRNLFSLWDC